VRRTLFWFFFSSRRRHTRSKRDWSSDVCSSDLNWESIDGEAAERLVVSLGARKIVDFAGPFGWDHSATDLGRVDHVADSPVEGVRARRRLVLPLVETRGDFALSREELLADA